MVVVTSDTNFDRFLYNDNQITQPDTADEVIFFCRSSSSARIRRASSRDDDDFRDGSGGFTTRPFFFGLRRPGALAAPFITCRGPPRLPNKSSSKALSPRNMNKSRVRPASSIVPDTELWRRGRAVPIATASRRGRYR